MFANKKLALGCTLAAVTALAFFAPSAFAVVKIGKGHNHNHNHSHNHHQHHNHKHNHFGHFQPHFQPVFKVPVKTVRIVYCVEVRQPKRYGDGGFHQVKCFSSYYQADRFADSLRDRFFGEPGFVVRIDRQVW